MATAVLNPILEELERDAGKAKGNTIPEGLISADSHITEPPHCYLDYIDPAYADLFYQSLAAGVEARPHLAPAGPRGIGLEQELPLVPRN